MIKKITFLWVILFTSYSFSQNATIDLPIANSSTGSGEERVRDGYVSTSSSDLEFYHDGSSEQIVGLSFEKVAIPKNSTITKAYIQFQADQEGAGEVTVNIHGDNSDNALSINAGVSHDISGRTPTSTNVNWEIASWVGEKNQASSNQRTPDISAIISEITSRSGWEFENNMAFIFTGVSKSSGASWREAESGSSTGAPILHIEFRLPPAEIDIVGNNTSIVNGDTSPDLIDNTQFGDIGVGQVFTQKFSIKNSGGQDLSLTGSPIVTINGDSQFTVITQPSSSVFGAGETVEFEIQYAPNSITTNNAVVLVESNDSDENPYTFNIQGSGAAAVIDVAVLGNAKAISNGDNTPDVLDNTNFGPMYSFTERTKTFTIENTGNSIVNISSVTSSNSNFTISSLLETTIGVGRSTTFDVTFVPSNTATNSATITINSNDSDDSSFTFDVEVETTNPIFSSTINAGDNWFYLSDGSNQGTAWRTLVFDQEDTWTEGATEIGYGDGDEKTDIGQPATPRPVTTYFRKYITIEDVSKFKSINLEAVRDDGMVVYINNVEVWRNNMPASESIKYDDHAESAIASGDEKAWNKRSVPSSFLKNGTNIIAVEIHQISSTSSDISFNFKLTPSENEVTTTVERGPYLQSGTSNSVVVKWRTDIATQSVVNYGTSVSSLSMNKTNDDLTTEHEVTLSGLTPNTKYYYNIGDKTKVLLEDVSGDMYVITAPTAGADQFVRAWILGDAGTANDNQRNVRDAYYDYVANASTNTGKTDMMLFLGDNAYNSGTDSEYQNAFFDIYEDMLRKSVAWSCLGNHDGGSADSATQSGPYYDIFTFPTAGEAGGTASGTEAYYSFDYANIHFIILDSQDSGREVGGSQYNWAKNDIQNTTQDWIVALFHHPAYTKGSHDSDYEGQLIDMRQNFMPMLEENGVDLVLNGHSHSYERSYFLNGHHGFANSFNPNEINNGGHTVGITGNGDGKADHDGVYQKTSNDTEGAVYITTGSAGKTSGGSLNHQAMSISLNKLGSCVMEIESDGKGGQNMTVKFVRENKNIDDYFTINKTGVTLAVGQNEIVEKSIKIFPVPANDLLNVKVNLDERLQTVKFFNSTGELVKEDKNETVNVSNMATGIYIIEINTDKKTYFKSVIIE
ncbi:choice-of-anchor D domain-containing protein [Wenyingzhuangia sp. 1_MG-2023]|nr:choice-of-anchor D domain-containing protein [Wenyingzhuangia sp. 1_MG-2023]